MAETKEVPLKLLDAIEDHVSRCVASAIEPFKQQIIELRNQLAERPVELPRPGMRGLSAFEIAKKYGFEGDAISWLLSLRGKDADPAVLREEVERAVAAAMSRMPTPEKPKDGKDADPDVMRAMVMTAVADQMKSLPKADPVDYDKIGDIIALAVAKEVSKYPPPKNGEPGKDADPAMVLEAIAKAFEAFPKPKDGEDADEDAIAARVLAEVVKQIPQPLPGPPGEVDRDELSAMVKEAVAAIPAPVAQQKGLEVSDVEAIVERAVAAIPEPVVPDIAPLVEAEVARQLAVLPKQESPKIDEAAIVARVFDLLPPPVPGEPGKSIEPETVQAMVDAAVSKMLAELPKPKDGEPVHPDTVALMVRDAVAQTVEKTIASIPAPKNGRDALDLEILDGIDPRKSYPAGTFALHDGGTVLALRDTDPLETVDGVVSAGWKVTQDGIKEVLREETDDERMTRIVVLSTSGRRFAVDCVTASGMKDQGVYRPGMKYRAGDSVTFDESYWTARRDTQKSPPGEDWRLILKGKRRS